MRYLFVFLILIISNFINAQTVTRWTIVRDCEGDCQNGYGVLNYENGDIYKGNYKNYKINGYGVYTWHTGGSYSGNWENGIKHGYGEMKWSSGTIWKGEWRNGEQYKGKTYWNQKGSSSASTSKLNNSKTKLDKDLEDELRSKYSNIATAQLNKIDAFPDKWSKYYNEKLKEIESSKAQLQELIKRKDRISASIRNLKSANNMDYSRSDSVNYALLSAYDFLIIQKLNYANKLIQKITKPNSNVLINSNLTQYIYVPKNGYLTRESVTDKWEKKQIKKLHKAGYIYRPDFSHRRNLITNFTNISPDTFSNRALLKKKKIELDELKKNEVKLNKEIELLPDHYKRCLNYINDRERQLNVQRYRAELREQKLEEERKEKERLERERKAEEEREKSNNYATNEQNYSRGNYNKKRINISDIDISKYVKTTTFRLNKYFKINFFSNGMVLFKIDGGQNYGTQMQGYWNNYGADAIKITDLQYIYGYFDISDNPKLNGVLYLQKNGSLSGAFGDYQARSNWILRPQ